MSEQIKILEDFLFKNQKKWKLEDGNLLLNSLEYITSKFDNNDLQQSIQNTINIAEIVVNEIGLGWDSTLAVIIYQLHALTEDIEINSNEIEEIFGDSVTTILSGLEKINKLDTNTVDLHSENYRKLLLAMSGDVRVILLKIAGKLYALRNLDNYSNQEKERLIKETQFLYAPFAHRLGLYNINTNLLDLCLKYSNPESYNYIVDRLKETETVRAKFTAEFVKPIQKKLENRNLSFTLKARTKSISSIYNKMQKKKVDFDEVMDLFAIRIILDSSLDDEKANCWLAYSIVTEEYQTNTNRLRDWITIPKSNGYESLHTTVLGPHGKWVEVQIRSQRMDEVAEKGMAAHWKYKGGSSNQKLDQWLTNIRDILENPELKIVDFIDQLNVETYSEEVFAFTPKGDLKRLRKGATLLDFAYEIHSHLGDTCVGGLVNNEKVPLKYEIKNGDYISIDTSSKQKPKLSWLDFVKTSKAKSRIKAKLNEERKNQAILGKEIVERKFKNWKIRLDDEAIRKILKYYNYKLAVDFYSDIAINKIDALEVKSLFVDDKKEIVKEEIKEIANEKISLEVENNDDYLIIDNNLKDVNYKLAPCCNPIFGDDIFGFVTINDGIKIHRQKCPNAKDIRTRYPYRVINAKWKSENKTIGFRTYIHISGTDKSNLISNIMHIINKDHGAKLLSINVNAEKGKFEGILQLSVYDITHLDFIIERIKQVNGVIEVTRSER